MRGKAYTLNEQHSLNFASAKWSLVISDNLYFYAKHSPKLFSGVGIQSGELHPPPGDVERVDDGDGSGARDGAACRHVGQAGGRISVYDGGGEPVEDVKLDAVGDGDGEQTGRESPIESSRSTLLQQLFFE